MLAQIARESSRQLQDWKFQHLKIEEEYKKQLSELTKLKKKHKKLQSRNKSARENKKYPKLQNLQKPRCLTTLQQAKERLTHQEKVRLTRLVGQVSGVLLNKPIQAKHFVVVFVST